MTATARRSLAETVIYPCLASTLALRELPENARQDNYQDAAIRTFAQKGLITRHGRTTKLQAATGSTFGTRNIFNDLFITAMVRLGTVVAIWFYQSEQPRY